MTVLVVCITCGQQLDDAAPLCPCDRERLAHAISRRLAETGPAPQAHRARARHRRRVTEPASVAELRGAIEDDRNASADYYCATMHAPDFRPVAAARARVDAILARLDVTGPVVRCAACPIRARAGEPCGHDVEDCAAYGGPTVTEPVAQPGEADEESAAREDIVAALVAALARARGALYSVKFGTSTASELDATIDATSWDAIRAKKGAGS